MSFFGQRKDFILVRCPSVLWSMMESWDTYVGLAVLYGSLNSSNIEISHKIMWPEMIDLTCFTVLDSELIGIHNVFRGNNLRFIPQQEM